MRLGIFRLAFSLAAITSVRAEARRFFGADDPHFAYVGRFDRSDPKEAVCMFSGCTVRTVFSGTSVELVLRDEARKNFFNVIIDGRLSVLASDRADGHYPLAQGLSAGRHTLEVIRRTEWHAGNTAFLGLEIDADGGLFMPEVQSRRIEFIGDSYTCGYGNEGRSHDEHFRYETENNYLSYGAVTARRLGAESLFVCKSGIGMVQSYGGDRSFNMVDAYSEVVQKKSLRWDYHQFEPQVVFIDLGDNDHNLSLDRDRFVQMYVEFLARLRAQYPNAKIVCAAGPSAGGEKWKEWQADMRAVVARRSAQDPQVYLFEFSNFEPSGSDWHPNVEQDARMAGELTPFLQKLLGW
jgi:hypothetical protein